MFTNYLSQFELLNFFLDIVKAKVHKGSAKAVSYKVVGHDFFDHTKMTLKMT